MGGRIAKIIYMCLPGGRILNPLTPQALDKLAQAARTGIFFCCGGVLYPFFII
jgi:hypothetical protein